MLLHATMRGAQKEIFDALHGIPVIDAHEHIPPEERRIANDADVFEFFNVTGYYIEHELYRAGMDQQSYLQLYDKKRPISERMEILEPYWQRCRDTLFGRHVRLSVEKFYGCDDITPDNAQAISQRIKSSNRTGLYKRILRDACNAECAITQCGTADFVSDTVKAVVPAPFACVNITRENLVSPKADWSGGMRGYEQGWTPIAVPGFEVPPQGFSGYLECVEEYVNQSHRMGAVGVKMYALPWNVPDRSAAESGFRHVCSGGTLLEYADNPLRDYVWDFIADICGKLSLVVCVHSGFGGDWRYLRPSSLLPVVRRHPSVHFDLYHLGFPWVNEAAMLGYANANVSLNLCWLHVISQGMVIHAMRMLADMLTPRQVIAFGGDGIMAEKAYGHLLLSKENVAAAFAGIVNEGRMTIENAVDLARRWYYDNPKEIYGL